MQVFIWISNIILLPEVKRIKKTRNKNVLFFNTRFFAGLTSDEEKLRRDVVKHPELKEYRRGGTVKIMYCLYGRHFHILKWERLLCFIHICVVICERKYWIIPIREIIIKKKQQNRWIHGWMRSGILEITVRIILCWQVWLLSGNT